MKWKYLTSRIKNMFKIQTIGGTSAVDTFGGDLQGPILEKYRDKGTTVNSICYN
jgi:hypothetical protein